MVESFPQSLTFLLEIEGGFARLKGDETTNLGVKKSTWEAYVGHLVSTADMKALTPAQVKPLYKERYWNACRCDDLPAGVDAYIFDFAVHSGPGTAIRHLQHILGITSDGKIGKLTLSAVKSMHPTNLINQLDERRGEFLKSLKNYQFFENGWKNRLKKVHRFCLDMVMKEKEKE